MHFKSIVGHKRQIEYFRAMIDGDKLAHAYCFNGEAGIGKFLFAKSLAREVLCQTEQDELKFDAGSHPDILVIQSETKILTAEIERITSFVNIRPLISTMKVILIDDAGMLSVDAQNKLLKTIESPPGHLLILLITQNASKLLPTVRSRVIDIGFSPLLEDDMKQLVGRYQLTLNMGLLQMSSGSFGNYLRWQSDEVFIEKIEGLINLLNKVFIGSEWVSSTAILSDFKKDANTLFWVTNRVMRDYFVASEGLPEQSLKLSNYTKKFASLAKKLTSKQIYGMIEFVEYAQQALDRNQNFDLVVERMLFNIQEAIHG